MSVGYDISITAGTEFSFSAVWSVDSVAQDITSATFEAKARGPGFTVVLDFSARVAITDAASGAFTVTILAADTSEWELTGFSGVWDLTITLSDGTPKTLISESRFSVNRRPSA